MLDEYCPLEEEVEKVDVRSVDLQLVDLKSVDLKKLDLELSGVSHEDACDLDVDRLNLGNLWPIEDIGVERVVSGVEADLEDKVKVLDDVEVYGEPEEVV